MKKEESERKIFSSMQLERRFYADSYEVGNGVTLHPSRVPVAATVDEFKQFLQSTPSYITMLDTSHGELIAEVLCLYSHNRGAHRKYYVSVLTPSGEVTDHENLILSDRDFSTYLARRVRIPLLLIDLVDFTMQDNEEQIRAILALRMQIQRAHRTYQQQAPVFAGSPVIKYHSVGDGFYIMFGQAESSTPAIKMGQIIFNELRNYNLGIGLRNKVYYRMVAHYGECTTLGGIDATGAVSAEPLFIGEIFNDCSRILSSCPRTEANLLYSTEAAYDYYGHERGSTFSELQIATDAKGKKHHYHIVMPPEDIE